MREVAPGMPDGPYPDDWAAVHHIIDEGWMYSLRFDDGVTSAGFLLTPRGLGGLGAGPDAMWLQLLRRYPTLGDAFGGAKPLMPIAFRPTIQHRLTSAAGERWVLMPHAYAFVDPLFSTGIAWSLRAVERLALGFEAAARGGRVPDAAFVARYDSAIAAEADQIDTVVAGAYEAMAHFDLFAAQAMLYFAAVSYSEVSQRIAPGDAVAWNGFLGVGDPVLEPLAREARRRLTRLTERHEEPSREDRLDFSEWMSRAIAPRNIAGLADTRRANLYPVDFDALVEAHDLLGLSRDQVMAALPMLRGMSAPAARTPGTNSGLAAMAPSPPLYASDEAINPR
jgi:tetracycline 7-halogenase / FADH2 O2-dependent halogenase